MNESCKNSNQRSVSNRVILYTYILLELILPAILLFYALSVDCVEIARSWFVKPTRLLFFFVSLPVTAVYAGLLRKTFFPKQNKKAVALFLFYLVNLIIYWVLHRSSGHLLLFLVVYNLPVYAGLNLCFLCGLIILVISKRGEIDAGEMVARLSVMAVLCVAMFTPLVYFLIFGWQLNLLLSGAVAGEIWIGVIYGVTLASQASIFMPRLRKMYIQGLL